MFFFLTSWAENSMSRCAAPGSCWLRERCVWCLIFDPELSFSEQNIARSSPYIQSYKRSAHIVVRWFDMTLRTFKIHCNMTARLDQNYVIKYTQRYTNQYIKGKRKAKGGKSYEWTLIRKIRKPLRLFLRVSHQFTIVCCTTQCLKIP